MRWRMLWEGVEKVPCGVILRPFTYTMRSVYNSLYLWSRAASYNIELKYAVSHAIYRYIVWGAMPYIWLAIDLDNPIPLT